MDTLIKQVLNDYFADFKKYHLIILIGFTIVIALIQIIQSFWINTRLEKFKSAMKKNEIKFSKFHELQVEALKIIYDKLVDFHGANSLLINSKYNSNSHSKYKKRIVYWIKTYIECMNEFSRKKLLLPDSLKIQIESTLKDFNEVRNILNNEKEDLELAEMYNDDDLNLIYSCEENESDVINEKIEIVKKKQSIINSEENIKNLRKSIENYFEEMNN